MGSERTNRRKKKSEMELAKKLAEPGPDKHVDWTLKMKKRGTKSKSHNWLDSLTPEERRQYDAEFRWAERAYLEDLPGPLRITIIN